MRELEGVNVTGWDHQKRVYGRIYGSNEGLLLHLGMGTGKTLISISESSNHDNVLIVAPKAALHVWSEQIEKFSTQNKQLTVLKGSLKDRLEQTITYKSGFLITNYDTFSSASSEIHALLMGKKFGLIIFDESHYVSGNTSRRTKRLYALIKALRRRHSCKILCLTGTPTTTDLTDLFTQIRLISTKAFGTSAFAFTNQYSCPDPSGYKRLWFRNCVGSKAEFDAIVAKYSIKIGREVLDLPEATHLTLHAEMNPEQKREHKSINAHLISAIKDVNIQNGAVAEMKLAQIANGFILDSNKLPHEISNSKVKLLKETIESIDSAEAIVVFYRFRYDLEMIRREIDVMTIAQLQEWRSGKGRILALQIQSGSEGIDCTRACYCVYYALDSLRTFEQSKARIHRPGQSKAVTYIHLISEGSADLKRFKAIQAGKDFLEWLFEQQKEG